ncbi:Intermembrane phospholipid transport system lipoprotein [Desulfonema limicola]|uniref:Intermembrane phospholipid transport system lipoprotein n=1 Tax=Desulfonema limicola TaxID=45656 RepID=A0A975B595_9BACT|nr:VacJ family lipoprotein [Desulfonema limicola]QTA79066.1 Intermembrane phospholipid transport system lipoprotein [Desulfonema limicola]
MKKKIYIIVGTLTFVLFGIVLFPGLSFSSSEDDEYAAIMEELEEEDKGSETYSVSDPLYYWNKAMFHVNDKLYFWAMKPVASGYKTITPTIVRSGIKNFFYNLGTPVRFVSCLLQGKSEAAGTELGRFMINTTFGVLGFGDLSYLDPKLTPPPDEDFGQTLGIWGIGNGIYLVWPVLGPSTLRDSIGAFSDSFLSPVTYTEPLSVSAGITAFDQINSLSFRLGDYETLKGAALEPYEAFRNAYIQYRVQKIKD